MSLFAIALLMFADPVEIDLDSCVGVDDIVTIGGEEVRTIKTVCSETGSPRLTITLAVTYPDLHGSNPDNPDGQTIIFWEDILNDDSGDVESISDFLERLQRRWEIEGRWVTPTNLSGE